MAKSFIFIVLLVSLSSIWGSQGENMSKRIRYQLEITSPDNNQVIFNATFFLAGESIRINEQKTPYTTTIESSELECLLNASDPVRIVMASADGRMESILESAYIKADKGKKRIIGM
jgi:hypothetical protein